MITAEKIYILIGSDDADLRADLRIELSRLGFTRHKFSGGVGLIQAARESQPNLVLIDSALKQVSHESVLLRELEQNLNLPLIMIDRNIKESILTGDNDYGVPVLTYPADEKDLFLMIHLVCHQHELDKKLKMGERRFRDLYDNSPDMYFNINSEGNILSVNRFGAEHLGYSPEEIQGHPVWSIAHEEDQQAVKEKIAEIFQKKISCSELEFRKLKKDRQIIWVRERTRLLIDESNNPRELLIICRDVTEQKVYEAELLASKEKYRSIYENLIDVYIEVTLEGIITEISPSVENVSGYQRKDLIGKSVIEFYRDPGSRDEFVMKLKKEGSLTGYEIILLDREKVERHCLISARLIRAEGSGTEKIIGFIRDNTENYRIEENRFKAENWFQTVFDTAEDYIFLKNRDLQYIAVNRKTENLFNLSQDKILGKDDNNLFEPEAARHINDIDRRVLQGETVREEHWKKIDGQSRCFQFIKVPMRDREGEIIGLCGIARDITELKQNQSQMAASKSNLKAVINSSKQPNILVDRDLNILMYNEAALKYAKQMMGSEITKGDHFLEIIHSDQTDKFKTLLQRAFQGERVNSDEIIKDPEDEDHWFNFSFNPVLHDDSEINNVFISIMDITLQKKSELNLRKSEEKLRTLLENSSDLIFYLDGNKQIQFLNRVFQSADTKDFSEHEIFAYFDDEYRENLELLFQKVIQTGKKAELEARGSQLLSRRYYSIVIGPILKERRISGFILNCHDISEARKSAVLQTVLYDIATLVHRTKEMNEVFGNLKEILSRVIDTTNFFVALYDRKTDTISLAYQVDQKDDFKSFPAGKSLTAYVIRHGKPLLASRNKIEEMVNSGEVEFIGTLASVWLGVPLKIGKEIIGVVVVQNYEDVTNYVEKDQHLLEFVSEHIAFCVERKRSEKALQKSENEFKLISQTIDDAFWIKDYKTREILYLSPAYEKIWETDPEKVYQDPECWFDLIHPEDIKTVREIVLDNDKTDFLIEYRIVTAKGNLKWVQEKAYLVTDEQKKDRIVGITVDISARKSAEQKLHENRELLQLINKILRHDLTNNLAVITSALRLFINSSDMNFIREAEQITRKSAELIIRMREMEKSLSVDKQLTPYALSEVIGKITANYSDLKIKLKGAGSVLADEALESVFDNLISNAVYHGKTDKIEIKISQRPEECIVSIADFGKGIPDEIKPKIFKESFSYGDTGKTGLGLYIVRKTLERYSAEIDVSDNEPSGSVFTVIFHQKSQNE